MLLSTAQNSTRSKTHTLNGQYTDHTLTGGQVASGVTEVLACKQARSTQPSTLSGTVNEYQLSG